MKPEDLLRRLPAQTPKLPSGCPALDAFLSGGIPCNSLTEIVAESGTGKTQFSLQLLLAATRAGASLYLHSEFPLPFRRLHRLSSSYKSNSPDDPLDSIFIHPLHSVDHLLDLLPRLDFLLPKLNIKLIVIDSIAALFRGEFENTPNELKRRSTIFFKLSSKLRFYACKFGLAVVLTNQVVDVMDHCSDHLRIGNSAALWSSGRRVCAALGLSWANCVNTRLFMWREVERIGDDDHENLANVKIRRFIRVVFAPHLPDSSCEFTITSEGVLGVAR